MSSGSAHSLLSRLVVQRSASCRTSSLASLWTTSTSANKPTGGGKQSKSQSSSSNASPDIASKNVEPPTFVFKKVGSELGPGAGKDKEYKNPEYFSYHQLSYADMDAVMAKMRCPQPSSIKSS